MRRPRYVEYKMALRRRMHNLRMWWLLRGLFIAACFTTHSYSQWKAITPYTPATPEEPGRFAPILHLLRTSPLMHLTQAAVEGGSMTASATANALPHLVDDALSRFTDPASAAGAASSEAAASVPCSGSPSSPASLDASGGGCGGSGSGKGAMAALISIAHKWQSLSSSTGASLAISALQSLAFLLAPLALAAISLFSLAACSASDFSGATTYQQQRWVWPSNQRGSHPAQTLPPRMPRPAFAQPLASLRHDLRPSTIASHVATGSGAGLLSPRANAASSSSSALRSSPTHAGSSVATGAPNQPSPLVDFLSPQRASPSASLNLSLIHI